MGATPKYGLPFPASSDAVKDGAVNIQSLAEAVEAAMTPPLLVTNSSGQPSWGTNKTARVQWNVADPGAFTRGAWTTGGPTDVEALVKPPSPGWYLVSTSFRFLGITTKDTFTLAIETNTAADPSAGFVWLQQQIEIAPTTEYTQLAVTSPVRIADAAYGVQIRVSYKGDTAPTTAEATNKLRIVRLSAL